MFLMIAGQIAEARRAEMQDQAARSRGTGATGGWPSGRPPSPAQIRLADERSGKLASAVTEMLQVLTHAGWSPRRARGRGATQHGPVVVGRARRRV